MARTYPSRGGIQAGSLSYYEALLDNPNVQRGLAVIRTTEGTAKSREPYNMAFGMRRIGDLSWHPGKSYKFTQTNGKANRTTAAGAYQFLKGTWNGVAKQLGLKSFNAKNQDIAALALIDRRGGLEPLVKGDVRGFVNAVGPEWASLPSAPDAYSQPRVGWSKVEKAWNGHGWELPATAPTPNPKQTPGAPVGQQYAEYAQSRRFAPIDPVARTQTAPISPVERGAPLSPALTPAAAPVPVSRNYPTLGGTRTAISPTPGDRLAPAPVSRLGPAFAPRLAGTEVTAPSFRGDTGAPQGSPWATNPLTSTIATIAEAIGIGTPRGKPAAPVEASRYTLGGPSPAALAEQYAAYGAGKIAPPPAPPLSPPQTVAAPPPVYQPPPPINPMQQAIDAAPYRAPEPDIPRGSQAAYDFYNGMNDQAFASTGEALNRDARGNTYITNKYGVTTGTDPRGNSFRASSIPGPLDAENPGEVGIRKPDWEAVGARAKPMLGGAIGGGLGGLLGPVGGLLGSVLGKELAKPGGGKIGDFVRGTKTVNTSLVQGFGNSTRFAKPQSGLAFPDAPGGGAKSAPKYSDNDYERMSKVSPKATKDIKAGRGGLY